MFGIQEKVADTAKRAGFLSGGLLLSAVGSAFMTVAGWFALMPSFGPSGTALIIGGIYLGLGLVLLGLGTSSSKSVDAARTHAKPQTDASSPPIVQAFMYGLQAGSQAERRS